MDETAAGRALLVQTVVCVSGRCMACGTVDGDTQEGLTAADMVDILVRGGWTFTGVWLCHRCSEANDTRKAAI